MDVWIDSAFAPKAVAEALEVEPVETGANLVLSQAPGDVPLAFRRAHEGAWLVDPVRLDFDLRKDPRRGREQADRLRQEVIRF